MDFVTSTRQAGSVTIVDISGRIVLGQESASLRNLINDLLSKGQKKILINLADVSYIDSSGLGSLVGSFTSVRKQGGELKLLNLTHKVHDLLQITRLYTAFDVMDDETEAVNSFCQAVTAIFADSLIASLRARRFSLPEIQNTANEFLEGKKCIHQVSLANVFVTDWANLRKIVLSSLFAIEVIAGEALWGPWVSLAITALTVAAALRLLPQVCGLQIRGRK